MNNKNNFHDIEAGSVELHSGDLRSGEVRSGEVRPVAPGDWPAAPPADASANDHAGLQFLSSARGKREFEVAQRHSGRVRWLRIVLPVTAVLIVAGFVFVLLWRAVDIDGITIGDIGIEQGKLVMENPQLTGVDSDKRPYSMKAARAFQDVKNPSDVSLEVIEAYMQVSDKNTARLTAGTGFYNTDSQKLKLGNKVALITEDGISINLQEADIDIASGTLNTNHPVLLKNSEAQISSQKLRVENKGDKIIFEERVRLTINPGDVEQDNEAAIASSKN